MSTDYLTPVLTGRTLLRANPVSKLFAAAVITLALMASIDWVSAAVVLTCELVLMPLLGISVLALARRIWPLLIAALIVWVGDQIGVGSQLSTAVVVVLGIRIFTNAAAIRRALFHA